jgi:hypothetical protein
LLVAQKQSRKQVVSFFLAVAFFQLRNEMDGRLNGIGQQRLTSLCLAQGFIELSGREKTAHPQLMDAIRDGHVSTVFQEVGMAAQDGQHGCLLIVGGR